MTLREFARKFNPFTGKPVTTAAPKLPNTSQGGTGIDILPGFGSNPPPFVEPGSDAVLNRFITSDPRDLWYLALPSKLTPAQVLQILRSALGGDIWQQWQLFSLMLDTWPMLRKCCHELRAAVSTTDFQVRPFALEGDEPTAKAIKKADAARRIVQLMRPTVGTDEKGFSGTIFDLTDAYVNGIVSMEMLWQDKPDLIYLRATAWVHPRQISLTSDGRFVVLYANQYHPIDPNKFIFGQFQSKSGSSLGAGMLRTLAWWWSAVMFNREWMLKFAERFGTPFRSTTYSKNATAQEIQKINDMLANAGALGWASFVEGTELTITPSQTLGRDNAQRAIMQMADTAAQLLILGQTLTTDASQGGTGGAGSRALGEVHNDVRAERKEQLAKWCGEVLTEQVMPAITRMNFGDDDECPVIEPKYTEEKDPLKVAQTFKVHMDAGVPVSAEEYYRENELQMPEPGDQVIIGGKLGLLGDTSQELDPNPKPIAPTGPDGQPIELGAAPFPASTNGNGMPKPGAPAKNGAASNGRANLKNIAKAVSPSRLALRRVIDASDADLDDAIKSLRSEMSALAAHHPKSAKVVEGMAASALVKRARSRRRFKP